MKKKIYTSPRIICIQVDGKETLLEDSIGGRNKQWQPTGTGGPTIDIKEEGDGNLGGEDTEVSGAKGSQLSWDVWD